MTPPFNYDWQAIRKDWLASGQSLLSYQQSQRLADLISGRKVPAYKTLHRHLASQNTTVSVHALSEEQIRSALCPEIFSPDSRGVMIRLPNGASIEFLSQSPEDLALKILQSTFGGVFS